MQLMNGNGFEKVMNVWQLTNKVLKPNHNINLLEIVDHIAFLFSAGNTYYLVFNLESYELEFVSDSIEDVLGIAPDSFTLDKFFSMLHPEDLEKIHEKEEISLNFKINKIPKEEIPLYKTVYLLRFKHSNGNYKTILHQSKAINVSLDGKVQQSIVVHTDISYLNIPFDHEVSLISNKGISYYSIETNDPNNFVINNFKEQFTRREVEIIENLSKGKNFNEIAEILFVSPHTINTHKKNILRKAQCKNTPEMITKCIREGVI